MFDCHYDLLTYIYMNRENLSKVKKHCNKIFNNNITGGIFNLFYMSPKEMKEELNINLNEIDIIKNLETVNKIVKESNFIPNNIKYIYGIEGLDYLNKIEDVDRIYELGVRSVNIVWNNDNKFGSGAKGDSKKGITKLGEKLIEKLVERKIAIDLSHANEKTFYDIVEICKNLKKSGKHPIVFASHSNCKKICDVPRNLSDEQILKIKELGGVIGIVAVKPFCIKEEKFNKDNKKYEQAYLKHINHIKELLGNADNIAVSTDDMTYYGTGYYKHFNVFKQENMKSDLQKLLLTNKFNEKDIEKILYLNFKNKVLNNL